MCFTKNLSNPRQLWAALTQFQACGVQNDFDMKNFIRILEKRVEKKKKDSSIIGALQQATYG